MVSVQGYARAHAPNLASHGGVPALDCLRCTLLRIYGAAWAGRAGGDVRRESANRSNRCSSCISGARGAGRASSRGGHQGGAVPTKSQHACHAVPCKEGSIPPGSARVGWAIRFLPSSMHLGSGGRLRARHVNTNLHRGAVRAGGAHRTPTLSEEQSRTTCSFQSLYTYRALSQASFLPTRAHTHTPLRPSLSPTPHAPTRRAIAIAALRAR